MSQFPQKYEAVFNIVNKNMFREQQILEWFLKDHVTHFTVYSNRKQLFYFLLYFWSNKSSLGEQKRHSKTWKKMTNPKLLTSSVY